MLQNYGTINQENCKFADELPVELETDPVPEPIAPPIQGELFKHC